jgi:protease-4
VKRPGTSASKRRSSRAANKDIGSPTREPTKEEAEIFRGLIDEAYADFVRVISRGRGIPEDRVREIADGRVYSGQQAKTLDLVDELGGLDRAADVARHLSKAREATVVRYTQEPGLAGLLSARLADDEPQAAKVLEEAGLDQTPKLQYLYRP